MQLFIIQSNNKWFSFSLSVFLKIKKSFLRLVPRVCCADLETELNRPHQPFKYGWVHYILVCSIKDLLENWGHNKLPYMYAKFMYLSYPCFFCVYNDHCSHLLIYFWGFQPVVRNSLRSTLGRVRQHIYKKSANKWGFW